MGRRVLGPVWLATRIPAELRRRAKRAAVARGLTLQGAGSSCHVSRVAATVVVALILVGAPGFVLLRGQQRMLEQRAWSPWLAAGVAAAIGSLGMRLGGARVARRMVGRLSAVSDCVDGIAAAGDPARRVPVDGDDAVGRLAVAINALLAILEHHEAALRAAASPDEPETCVPGASLAAMSHDLRTPLDVIVGSTQLLSEEPIIAAHPELRARLDRVQRAGLRLLTTFQGLLDQGFLDAVEVA